MDFTMRPNMSSCATSACPLDHTPGPRKQDLAPAHIVKTTRNWFANRGITVLDWLANSPDLNLIENLRGIVKRKKRDTRFQNTGTSGQTSQETVVEKTSKMKEQIEERLKQLEDEITASFPSTGFDRHTSLVFSPANPENTIEDSLAMLGDRVAQVLDTHLASATQTLLSGQLDYEHFQIAVKEISSHSEGGWSKVLVPLVLLQALHCKGEPLASLLSLGERYLAEAEADFIIQQGGWSAVFSLEDVEEPGVLLAEDSNDIYILSGEQDREQLSSPELLLTSTADSSNLSSWHTESLPVSLSGHDSWAQVGTMEPEDAKSVDSGEGVASAEERSENNSSNSDIVHVEREEAELLEEGEAGEVGELQESVLSVLGSESEMEALRDEFRKEVSFPQQAVTEAPDSLMSLEEQIVILEAPPSLVAAVPAVDVKPKSLTSSCPTVIAPVDFPESRAPLPPKVIADSPVKVRSEHPSVAASPQVLDPKPKLKSAQSEPVPTPVEPLILRTVQEPEAKSEPQPEAAQAAPVHKILPQEAHARVVQGITAQVSPLIPPVLAQAISSLETQIQKSYVPSQSYVLPPEQEIMPEEHKRVHTAFVPAQEPPATPSPTEEPVSSELSFLLYGGAALVAIVALLAYGALVYRKK